MNETAIAADTWERIPVWAALQQRKLQGYPELPLLSVYRDHGVVLKDSRDDNHNRDAVDLNVYQVVRPGEVVMNKMKAWQGSVAVSWHLGLVSPDYMVLAVRHPHVHPGFLHYQLRSEPYVAEYRNRSYGVRPSQWRLMYDDFRTIELALPPVSIQKAIADFLDRKTAAIDALIEKKQKLLELLAEKRAALINQAVTKGLDPNVPMDSTTDVSGFFAEVRSTWTLLRLKFLVRDVKDGPHYSPTYVDRDQGGYLFLSARNVRVNGWSFDDAKFVSEELFKDFSRRISPQRGDVLYTKGGTTGVARAVDFDEPFQVWVHIAVLKVIRSRVNPFYLAYALNSSGCYAQAQLYTRGATNNDLGLTRMINIEMPWPPLSEQNEIVDWLDQRLAVIDKASRRRGEQIDRLKEYRQALITAAVTGQLDIKNPPPAEPS